MGLFLSLIKTSPPRAENKKVDVRKNLKKCYLIFILIKWELGCFFLVARFFEGLGGLEKIKSCPEIPKVTIVKNEP